MKLLFVSDALTLDEDFVPLAELLNLENERVGRTVGVRRENHDRIMRANESTARNTTYFFRMPEAVLVQAQEKIEAMEKEPGWVLDAVTEIFRFDHPQWVPMRPSIPMVMMYCTSRISVLTTKKLTILIDKENPHGN